MGEMTSSRDFVTDPNGDLYPLVRKSADCDEAVAYNHYLLTRGSACRVMGAFFPYATYEVTFRAEGWGCVIPIRQGSRMRCYWLTFDRHRGSDYTWSYGNLYGFEAIED